MNIAFAGTPSFAANILKTLIEDGFNVVAVYTQPDKKTGRGQQMTISPVKQYAQSQSLKIYQDEKLTDLVDGIDVMVVVAYGQILPNKVLNAPKYGCINIHTSILPRWRGAAPIEHAILAGDKQSGVSIIKINAQLDAGDILAQQICPISPDDTSTSLKEKLQTISQQLISKTLKQLTHIQAKKQTHTHLCYAPKIHTAQSWINWQQSALAIHRQIRAMQTKPGARSYAFGKSFKKQIIKIIKADVLDEKTSDNDIGTVIEQSKNGIDVQTGSGILRIVNLQLAGKKASTAADFSNAYQLLKFTSSE